MEERKNQKIQIAKAIDLARYFDYTKKCYDKSLNYQVSITNISGKGTYSKNKESFDKLFEVYKKQNFDFQSYFKYLVINGIHVSKCANPNVFYSFVEDLKTKENYKKIYGYFLKSAKNIAEECKVNNFKKTIEYLKYAIKNNILANMYLSGKISGYYLANISLLPKIISKMDQISRDTLNHLVLQQDKINSDLQDACSFIRGTQVDVIKFTDKLIETR